MRAQEMQPERGQAQAMRVQVVLAWPDRYQSCQLELPDGATVADAVEATGWEVAPQSPAVAVHGLLARPDQMLRDGDRVELLRPLLADPKENRRRRAGGGRP